MKYLNYFSLLLIAILFQGNLSAQHKVVALDNYYNNEISSKTGKPFHYLWTDSALSGFSQWGSLFEKQGAQLRTLHEAPTTTNLKEANIYIIVDPDTPNETKSPRYLDQKAIKNIVTWVKKGGVLVLMENDSLNAEFQHFNQLADKFGMHFNEVSIHHVTGHQYDMGSFTNLPDNPVFKGVSKIYMKEISTITLSGEAKPVLTENGKVIIAVASFGKGNVITIGDPWLYNEYIDHAKLPESFQNMKAAQNFTAWLISLTNN